MPLHLSSAHATPTSREKSPRHPRRKISAESEAETCRAVAGTVLAALLGAHDSGAVSSLWLLGLDWVWQASGRALTSGFGKATLLESLGACAEFGGAALLQGWDDGG